MLILGGNMKKLKLSVLLLILSLGVGCAKSQLESGENGTTMSTAENMDVYQESIAEVQDMSIYFGFNEYDISMEDREKLKQKADIMRQYPNIRVRIEGNCDVRGTQEYNLALGERRARAAYEYLVLLGVNPDQIDLISYGKERPVVAGNSEAAHAQNRRDDFNVIAY